MYTLPTIHTFSVIPDIVRVISCGFPATLPEQDDASACVRLELLIVSVIS